MTNAESVRKARAALDAGKDFELVARTMSENPVTAANGGLLPPFSRFDDVPKLLRDAAFALPPGQISSTLHENDAYYILRVEQKFPPSSVGIDNVKDELRKRIKDRLVRRRMNEMAGEVFRATDIGIQDEKLRQAFREKYPEARAH
jgi:peptidyl-prolyl cis-trans isomerase D